MPSEISFLGIKGLAGATFPPLLGWGGPLQREISACGITPLLSTPMLEVAMSRIKPLAHEILFLLKTGGHALLVWNRHEIAQPTR